MGKNILGNKRDIYDYLLIGVGAFVQALAMRLFLIPGLLVSGGVSGAAQIINHFLPLPIGAMVLAGNLPLISLGWRFLGGRRFAVRTTVAIILFSLFTDGLSLILPDGGITADVVLMALYGGVLLGIGLGLVYRGRGTSGGSDILGRILSHRRGIPTSSAYLITDGLVVLASGIAFGWSQALYGLIVIYISGLTAEFTSVGNRILRVAWIITNQKEEVSAGICKEMERGVTIIPGIGAYTGELRPILYCVLTRSEVNVLKEIVREADPKAFMVIGLVHEALGEGFLPLDKTGSF